MITDIEEAMMLVGQFNEKYDMKTDNQALMLGAETGELQEAILKDDYDNMKEEVGDVLFVVVSICINESISPVEALEEVSKENMNKSTSKEGGKVTKE